MTKLDVDLEENTQIVMEMHQRALFFETVWFRGLVATAITLVISGLITFFVSFFY